MIDLHMHSYYSDDGQYTPLELIEMCSKASIEIMAITDHNWIKANKEAKALAKEHHIQYIPAIEIDCTYKGINLHVLGYGVDDHQELNDLGEAIEKQELACSMKKLDLTNALGFELTKEQLDNLSTNGVYTGEMFGEVLLNDERYINNELLKPYRKGGLRSDNPYVNFYWDYYAQGKPCYTEIQLPALEEIIELIHKHGGKAILAHPGNNLKDRFEIFDEMIELGIDGVEAYSSYHNDKDNLYFYNKAKENQLIFTCGSDFHGKTKPAITLGGHHCPYLEEVKESLIKHGLIEE